MSKITPNDVELLIGLFDASDWKEMHLESADFELHLSKNPAGHVRQSNFREITSRETRDAVIPANAGIQKAATTAADKGLDSGVRRNDVVIPDHWLAIRAPNLGTFYRAPKPGAPPYVEIGQAVTPETEICLIEVMKLFTTVRAGVAGTVRQVCVADAEMIEHDQVLFYVEP